LRNDFVTSFYCVHLMWLILEDTCMQVIRFIIWLIALLTDFDYETLYYYVILWLCIDICYWLVSLECEGILTDRGCRWHRWTSLDFGSSDGVNCMVWLFLLLHMWHMMGYIMMLFMNGWLVSSMDAGWQFLANQTHIWNKGVMHDNEIYWGGCVV